MSACNLSTEQDGASSAQLFRRGHATKPSVILLPPIQPMSLEDDWAGLLHPTCAASSIDAAAFDRPWTSATKRALWISAPSSPEQRAIALSSSDKAQSSSPTKPSPLLPPLLQYHEATSTTIHTAQVDSFDSSPFKLDLSASSSSKGLLRSSTPDVVRSPRPKNPRQLMLSPSRPICRSSSFSSPLSSCKPGSASSKSEDPFALEVQVALMAVSSRPLLSSRRQTFADSYKPVSPSPGLHRYQGQDALPPSMARSSPSCSRRPSMSRLCISPLASRRPSMQAERPPLTRSTPSEVSVFDSDTDSGDDRASRKHRGSDSTTTSAKLRKLFGRKRHVRPSIERGLSALSVVGMPSIDLTTEEAAVRLMLAAPLTIGTLEQLLDSWLSSPNAMIDDNLIQLLIYYHALTQTDIEFFRSLTHYFWQQQEGDYVTRAEKVLEVLLRWVVLQPRDFCDTETLADVCLLFCGEVRQTAFHVAAFEIERALTSQLQYHRTTTQVVSRKRNISLDSESAALHQSTIKPTPSFHPFPERASTLAEYLTASSLMLLRSVLTVETVRYWVRKNMKGAYNGNSPVLKALRDIMKRNMLLEQWTEGQICQAEAPLRLSMAQHLLDVCDELLICADLNALICITRGLLRPATQHALAEAGSLTAPAKATLDSLARIICKDGSYATYHQRIAMHGQHVVVPSLDIFLEELTMLASATQLKGQTGNALKQVSSIVKGGPHVLDLDLAKFLHTHLLAYQRMLNRDNSYGSLLGTGAYVCHLYIRHQDMDGPQVPEVGMLDALSEMFERQLMVPL